MKLKIKLQCSSRVSLDNFKICYGSADMESYVKYHSNIKKRKLKKPQSPLKGCFGTLKLSDEVWWTV